MKICPVSLRALESFRKKKLFCFIKSDIPQQNICHADYPLYDGNMTTTDFSTCSKQLSTKTRNGKHIDKYDVSTRSGPIKLEHFYLICSAALARFPLQEDVDFLQGEKLAHLLSLANNTEFRAFCLEQRMHGRMVDDVFSLDQLNDMKFNICCKIDAYLEQAEGLIRRINAFNSQDESAPASDSSSAALIYLHRRFADVMKEFADCNEDLFRLEQIIQEMSLLTQPKKRIQAASDEEFLVRVKEQYAYQMFGTRLEDL